MVDSVDECAAALRVYVWISSNTISPSPIAAPLQQTSTTSSDVANSVSRGSNNNNKTTEATKSTARTTAVSTTSITAETAAPPSYDRWTLLDDGAIDYGYLSRCDKHTVNLTNTSSDPDRLFYITTAINYTNGPAHIGHAYEAATADVIARYQRLVRGSSMVHFVTGSDEHGQKIAQTAIDHGITDTIQLCDRFVTGFQVLNQRLRMSADDYIRTTSQRHKLNAQRLWQRCADADDIYLDTYTGWYNVREETFVTDSEAALSDYKDPVSGVPLKQVEEESYFFRMSKYYDQLVNHLEQNPTFCQPEQHRRHIIQRLKAEPLRDLSISRTTFDWGVPVPTGFANHHVMYVWLDALSNYLTGVNVLDSDPNAAEGLKQFWPASVHIIGKDILWFHVVIWPCLLMSAGLSLPKSVFAHGFVADHEGKKMSKSMGNVVDPHDMLDQYHVDTFRWYLCKEAPYGGELAFSESSMRDMNNSDLCDTVGNLIHRVTNLCHKYCAGVIPDVEPSQPLAVLDLPSLIQHYQSKMDVFELQAGAALAMQGFRDVNGYLQEQAPWTLKGDEHITTRQQIVRTCLEAVYVLAHLLLPFVPLGAAQIFAKLHTEPVAKLGQLQLDHTSYRNLQAGTVIDIGEVLYVKAMSAQEKLDAAVASAASSAPVQTRESFADAQKRKKEAKAKANASSQQGTTSANAAASAGSDAADTDQSDFTKMEIRVGKIVKVWNHPQADKLFCEQIDVGDSDGSPREIASGLRDHYTLDEMQDRKVLVVCNLKAVKMLGFTSNGMVLATKSTDGTRVELIDPSPDAETGERVFIDGLLGEPYSAAQVKKRKTWEAVSQSLRTNGEGLATWAGKVLQTKAGPCKAATLTDTPIS